MSDKEKLEAIKNGKDIDEETVVVLQSTDFAKEKKEEVKEEVAPSIESNIETSEEPKQESVDASVSFEPDIKIGAEIPNISVPTEEPAVMPESEVSATPVPEPAPFTINLDGINADTTTSEISTPAYEQPVQNNNFDYNSFNSMTSDNFDKESTTSSSDLFNSAYSTVTDNTKEIATVVTEQDEVNAKNAHMLAYEKLYDVGPGKQISILRNFSQEAAKWIRAADKSGFVSGEMHDIAKKILREYEGLKDEQNEFSDE